MKSLCAMVTGASAGIGKEFARQLHAAGYNLVLVARREELLAELANALNQVRPESVVFIAADLASQDSANGLPCVEQYLQENPVDLLVNNAGRGSFGAFEEIERAVETEMIALNITASMRLAHIALPAMKAAGRGGIISISSIAGFQPIPFMATYAATKAFNLFHSLGLAFELRGSGVHVTIVCPGPVATEFGGVARVPGMATGTSRSPVSAVVRESLVAYERKRVIVVPCLKAKCLAAVSRLTPLRLSTWITGKILVPVLKASTARGAGKSSPSS